WRHSEGARGCDNAVAQQPRGRFCRSRRIGQARYLRSCSSLEDLHQTLLQHHLSRGLFQLKRALRAFVQTCPLASDATSLFLAASASWAQLAARSAEAISPISASSLSRMANCSP